MGCMADSQVDKNENVRVEMKNVPLKRCKQMIKNSLKEFMADMCHALGMIPQGEVDPFGIHLTGNGKTTQGYFWYFAYENHFVVSHCDFVFCEDQKLDMPPDIPYISLRLDTANHLLPGKIISFMEEKAGQTSTQMKTGTRVAYTEVLYVPEFYTRHLKMCFPSLKDNPTQILKNMGGVHNWPSEMMDILTDIRKCSLPGAAAELFLVAKAYELMAALVKMGDVRSPRNIADYARILAVIRHLDENLNRNVRQNELVRISNMSATKLKLVFKQFTGRTLTGYILEKKADKAAHLLSDTNLSIEEISGSVGFDTPTGFATSFKKQIGTSPTEYRRRMAFYCTKNPSEIKGISFS